MNNESRVVTKEQLLLLGRIAEDQNYNRQVRIDELEHDLDPDGFNVLVMSLPFHNDTPVHRVTVLAKAIGRIPPVMFLLDVSAPVWEELATVKDVQAIQRGETPMEETR